MAEKKFELTFPSKLFTEKEKEVAKEIYDIASATYFELWKPKKDEEFLRESIQKWHKKLNQLLDIMEVPRTPLEKTVKAGIEVGVSPEKGLV
ncbi:MAG: hypothetical protein ACPLXS_03405 [Candidatus Micrarchaeales archaeon]